MKNRIYYFTGTGNSLRAARILGESLGGAQLIHSRCDPEAVPALDADAIGFVCPVYEWDIPGAFREFIRRLQVRPQAYFFMVVTYIAVHGKSFETVEALLEEKGAHLDYGRALRCVASQCTAYPPFPPERWMVPYMERQMRRAGEEIAQRSARPYPHMSPLARRRYPKAMGPYLAVEKEYDKGFFTDGRCIGCGTCARVCPTRNITMEGGRPVWNHRCHGCNACVAYCPTKAVQFQTPQAYRELGTAVSRLLRLPEGRKRYHHPMISAADLTSDREEIFPGGKE